MVYINLIKARREKGLTQKQMADLLAMEQTTYSKKERGISRIRENEWVRFANILQKDVDKLKSKNKNKSSSANVDKHMYLNIIKIIIKYNKKLESEILKLREQLKEINHI